MLNFILKKKHNLTGYGNIYQQADLRSLMPNTHRRSQRDETVESRRVGGVNTNSQLVGDSFVVSLVCTHPSAVVNWVTADGCVVRSHRRIRRQSSRIHVHTADADATKQFRRVGVGGVYWASV